MPRKRLLAGLCAALLALPAAAKEKLTERTFKLAAGEKSPPARIDDISWLAGRWTGEALGGVSEEIWSAPRGGAMMGMYRLVREGKPVFYELCTIVEENGSLLLRLKHFNADLTGWEEKARTVDFPLVAIEGGAFHFEGMSLHPQGQDKLTVYLAIGSKDGKVREETFAYTR
ncbi:MAG TPA: DUF6265 family protein [Vicinamibacteria bacterium]